MQKLGTIFLTRLWTRNFEYDFLHIKGYEKNQNFTKNLQNFVLENFRQKINFWKQKMNKKYTKSDLWTRWVVKCIVNFSRWELFIYNGVKSATNSYIMLWRHFEKKNSLRFSQNKNILYIKYPKIDTSKGLAAKKIYF